MRISWSKPLRKKREDYRVKPSYVYRSPLNIALWALSIIIAFAALMLSGVLGGLSTIAMIALGTIGSSIAQLFSGARQDVVNIVNEFEDIKVWALVDSKVVAELENSVLFLTWSSLFKSNYLFIEPFYTKAFYARMLKVKFSKRSLVIARKELDGRQQVLVFRAEFEIPSSREKRVVLRGYGKVVKVTSKRKAMEKRDFKELLKIASGI